MELGFNILEVYLKYECELYQTSPSRLLLIVATVQYIPAVCLDPSSR